MGKTSWERATALIGAGVDVLVVDTAHGHSKNVMEMVEYIHRQYKDIVLVAGNVVTPQATKALMSKGVDVVQGGNWAGKYLYNENGDRCGYATDFSGC